MINAMYEYNMVSHPLAEAVTGVAVSSEWGPRIMKAAQGLFGKDAVSPQGFVFNEKLPLVLVKPIRFANLRAIDIRTVSISCVCHLSVDGCTQCFLCSFNRCLLHIKFVKFSTVQSGLVLTSVQHIFHIFLRFLSLSRDIRCFQGLPSAPSNPCFFSSPGFTMHMKLIGS